MMDDCNWSELESVPCSKCGEEIGWPPDAKEEPLCIDCALERIQELEAALRYCLVRESLIVYDDVTDQWELDTLLDIPEKVREAAALVGIEVIVEEE